MGPALQRMAEETLRCVRGTRPWLIHQPAHKRKGKPSSLCACFD